VVVIAFQIEVELVVIVAICHCGARCRMEIVVGWIVQKQLMSACCFTGA